LALPPTRPDAQNRDKEVTVNRILLATDGSEHSMRAATLAGELSSHFEVPVDIINVVPDSTPVVSGAVHEYAKLEQTYVTQRDLLKSLGTEVVGRAASHVNDAGGDVGAQEVMIGSPAHGIVAFAKGVGADSIVMGRRGLGEIKGLLMGSVSHRVGHLTDVTLITVR
jgi:nucleotide-binding universal stress UspA family protein